MIPIEATHLGSLVSLSMKAPICRATDGLGLLYAVVVEEGVIGWGRLCKVSLGSTEAAKDRPLYPLGTSSLGGTAVRLMNHAKGWPWQVSGFFDSSDAPSDSGRHVTSYQEDLEYDEITDRPR